MEGIQNESGAIMTGPGTKTYKLSYAFKQQLMRAWRPRPTLKCAITIYAIIGLIFFALGITILVLNDQVWEVFMRYDDRCQSIGESCVMEFEVDKDLVQQPIYIYYQIRGFYQNHRRYIQSVSYSQLREKRMMNLDEISDCAPVTTNHNTFRNVSVTGVPLVPGEPAFPCGIVARSFFNDSFVLSNLIDNNTIPISDKGIAWPDDKKYKFLNADLNKQWIDVESERFITWMKISPFRDFRKSWGVIRTDLRKGRYKFFIQNNWNASIFGGEKWIVLSQANVFGGKNEFLAFSYLAVGALAIILAIAFVFRKIKRPKGVLEEKIKEFS